MIQLVPSLPAYAENWRKWRAEANTIRFNPVLQSPAEELRARMAKMSSDLSDLKAAEEFIFFVELEDHLVGSVTLKGISHMMNYGEIGYTISEEVQGQGIGTAAVKMFVQKIFAETSLRRITAYVAEENVASRRILEKNRFVQEGILREHLILNGKPTNEVLYWLLRKDLQFTEANS